MVMSFSVSIPMEDCESFRWAVKKSVSSYTARSGELADDDADVDPPFSATCGLGRGMMCK